MDSSSTMTGTLSSVMLATGMQVCDPKPLPVMVMVSLGSASVLLTFRSPPVMVILLSR